MSAFAHPALYCDDCHALIEPVRRHLRWLGGLGRCVVFVVREIPSLRASFSRLSTQVGAKPASPSGSAPLSPVPRAAKINGGRFLQLSVGGGRALQGALAAI
jgi:hypothetical protein